MAKKLNHLAIIMDGNRRWAKREGLQAYQGHQTGRDNLEKVLKWCKQANIKILTVYAFSAENWQRPKKEVDFLMKLFIQSFKNEALRIHKDKIKIKVFGRLSQLPINLQKAINKAVELSQNNKEGVLNLCLNYSGRLEIVDAINSLIKNKKDLKEINEKDIENNLYSQNIADPDLIIRTSGERRLSGFLLWQVAYSELLFIDKYWPEFSKEDFDQAIACFYKRKRRFGC
jgi:undecaprenyl diphosphate synthase